MQKTWSSGNNDAQSRLRATEVKSYVVWLLICGWLRYFSPTMFKLTIKASEKHAIFSSVHSLRGHWTCCLTDHSFLACFWLHTERRSYAACNPKLQRPLTGSTDITRLHACLIQMSVVELHLQLDSKSDSWGYTSRYRPELHKSSKSQGSALLWQSLHLSFVRQRHYPHVPATPVTKRTGHLIVRMSAWFVSGRMHVYSRKTFIHFLLVCITTNASQRLAGAGRKSVGSLNPVNVEQHLIRSAPHRPAALLSAM